MATITTRSGKGSPLSHSEGDSNFTNLNNDKLENLSEDTSPQLGGNLDVNSQQIVSTSNANVKIYPNGTGVLEVGGDGSSNDGTIQLNCSQNSHGVKIKSPPHSAGASYTLTLPTTDGNADEFLKTDGSGGLSWGTASGGSSTLVDLTDTSIASPSNGQVLAYNSGSSNWTNQGIDISSKSINDLSDVSASGPSDGQVLTYSNANSRFEPQTPSGGGGSVAHIRLGNASSDYGSSGDTAAGMLVGSSTDSYWDTSWITFSATGSPSNWHYNFVLQPGEYSLVCSIKPATSNSGSGTYRIYNVSSSSFNSNSYEQYWAEWKDISDFNAVIPFNAVLAPSSSTTYELAMGSRDQLPDSITITKLS